MRTIFGFIIGVAATISVVFFHDNAINTPGSNIVNWDQAGEFGRNIVETGRNFIERLVGK